MTAIENPHLFHLKVNFLWVGCVGCVASIFSICQKLQMTVNFQKVGAFTTESRWVLENEPVDY